MSKQEAKKNIQALVEKYKQVLKEGKINSYNEAQTRNEFIEPLFEYLGWDMRNLHTQGEVTTEENVSNRRVDLAFRIGHIPVMFLEAKARKVDIDKREWAEQAINYSWNKGVTWAVLTDFESLKVFNAELPPTNIAQNQFFEIAAEDYLEEFDQLWLLSKESFEQGLLDKLAEKWGKLTKRKQVGEKLFDDLMAWRHLLTQEFKKKRKLSDDELDEGVQRIIDRLIFIRTAEDRKIEPNILNSLLRGEKKELYRQVGDTFRDFDAHYNSKLFSKHYCEEWKADDSVYKTIINGMYQTEDGYRYDFSAISGDILGGIYEQYLGYVQTRKGQDNGKSKRKSQGIYYTPKYIVDYIVKETLCELLKKTKPKDINKIKVLDPACGSGSFLIAAYDAFDSHIRNHDLLTRFAILGENIYGVDLDPQAVEIAQLNLLLKVLSERKKLPKLQHNLRVGNSLIGGNLNGLQLYFRDAWKEHKAFDWQEEFPEVFQNDGFHVIIGNPPYIFARGQNFDNPVKSYYYDHYELTNYQINTYLLFIERSYALLKIGGYFGFIIPNNWLTIGTFAPLRKFLLDTVGNLKIINIYDKVFADANVDTCLLIFKKGRRSKVTLGEFRDGKLEIVGKYPASVFNNNNYVINISLAKCGNKIPILKKIQDKSNPLKNYATVSTGLKAYQTGKGKPTQTDSAKNNRIFHARTKKDSSYVKYLDGKDVMRYRIGWSGEFLRYGDWLAEPRKSVPFNGARILVRQIPSLPPYAINAVYTKTKALNDINSMVLFKFQVDPLFLLAALNSRLTTFWFANTFDKFQRKTFPQFKVKELAVFPIPHTSEKNQADVSKLAELMLLLQKELQEIPINTDKHTQLASEIIRLDRKIDQKIYKLYGLTIENIKIIEGSE